MDEDSLVGLGDLIRTLCGEAWGLKFDNLAISDSTYGALATSGINETIMGTGDVNFASVDFDDLDALIADLTTEAMRQGARYIMHTTVFDYFRGAKDDMGRYIFQDAAPGAPATLRGFPYVLSDGAPSSGDSAASTSFLLFGNPRHIIAGDRIGFEFRIFDQTGGTMEYDQIYLRARVRQAMVLGLPSAMTKLTTAAS
jgi:HK97 family phage major capsid protein